MDQYSDPKCTNSIQTSYDYRWTRDVQKHGGSIHLIHISPGATWYIRCIQSNELWFGHNCLFKRLMVKVNFHSNVILDRSCDTFIAAVLFLTITCTKKKAREIIICSLTQSHSKTPYLMERQLVVTGHFACRPDLIWPDYVHNNKIYSLLWSHNLPVKSVIFWQICYILFLKLKPPVVKS